MPEVRVRFAPSPTGNLHVGGARTALFNYLYARKCGGKFFLRIEDTDRARSRREYVDDIIAGLKYLGIYPFDQEPVYQSRRRVNHILAAERLLDEGKVYRCFCPPAKLEEERERALKSSGEYKYPGYCLGLSPSEITRRLEAGEGFAVRFKVEGDAVEYIDSVHGRVRVGIGEIDDFIILRRDHTPTYMLSVVVDDRDMGITHVIRGDDHISNTPKQIMLHRALDNSPPEFAHLPLILGPDRKRLSKRHGAASVLEYRRQGIPGSALRNYLALLGWSPGGDAEVFVTAEELAAAFTLERISTASAVFDSGKLEWMSGIYMSALPDDSIEAEVKDWLEDYGEGLGIVTEDKEYLGKVIKLARTRAKNIADLFSESDYYFRDPEDYDAKGVKKHFKTGLSPRLRTLVGDFTRLADFSAEGVEAIIRGRAEEWGISAGKLIHPLRLALTGKTASPGLFELMEALGRERVARRVEGAARFLEESGLAE